VERLFKPVRSDNTQSAGPIIGVHEASWCVSRKHVAKECLGQKIPAYLPT
jgi:hypothetical protein